MKKRYTDCDIWDDEFFQRLSPAYKLFWFYICNKCDHAGIWKPTVVGFTATTKLRVRLDRFLVAVNRDKERVTVLDNGRWYLANFCQFQYTAGDRVVNSGMNVKNSVHLSALKILNKNGIKVDSLLRKSDRKNILRRLSTEHQQTVGYKEEDKEELQYKGRSTGPSLHTKTTIPPRVCHRCGESILGTQIESHDALCLKKQTDHARSVAQGENKL